MLRKTYFAFLFICLNYVVLAQNGTPQRAGARGSGMGDASVTFQDINSAFSNQAGLAFIDGLSFTVFGERRFLLAEINSFSAAAAMPTNSGTFGLAVNYFGYTNYNEQKIGLSYARRLFEHVGIGAQIDYIGTRIPEYGTASSITFELGTQAQILEKVIVGAHIFSPIRVKLTEDDRDIIPAQLKAGFSYLPSDKVTLAFEVEKDIDYKASFKSGVEYRVVEQLSLRAGLGTEPVQNSFGIGIHLPNLDIDFSTLYHYELGFTPGISIAYGMRKSNTKTPSSPVKK